MFSLADGTEQRAIELKMAERVVESQFDSHLYWKEPLLALSGVRIILSAGFFLSQHWGRRDGRAGAEA